jgi:creatinine amidohydrolase
MVADQAGGIVVPPVWCGFSTLADNGLPYTLEFGRDTVMLLLKEYLEQLAMVGFKLVVVLTGHYGPKHVAALVEAANTFTVSGRLAQTVVWVLPEYELARELGYHGDHAAKWETSILMHLRPELVDMERLDDRTATEGIYGEDPRRSANSELGAQVVESIVEHLSGRVAKFLRS